MWYMGLCVTSWRNSPQMILRIFILHLIISIKFDIEPLNQCIEVGHETMVCTVRFYYALMGDKMRWGKKSLSKIDQIVQYMFMRYISYQSQICCKVASLRDHHGHFIRRIKLILRGHMTAVRHRWEGAHIPGRDWWPGGGYIFLWTQGSCIATYCPLGLSLWHRPFWWGVHGLPQLFVETSFLGGLSSLSPGYGQFHWHTAQGILDTGFHRRHHFLWSGVINRDRSLSKDGYRYFYLMTSISPNMR